MPGAGLRENDRVTNVAGPGRLRSLAAELWHRVEGAPSAGRSATARSRVFDAALVLLLVLAGLHYVEAVGAGPAGPASIHWGLLVPLAAVPLLLRRRFPVSVLWTVLALTLLIRNDSPDVAYYAGLLCIVAAYAAAAHGPRPLPTLLSLPAAVAVLAYLFAHAQLPDFPNGVIAVLVLVPVFAAAWEIRMWRRRTDEGRARLSALEREQVAALNLAVEHERARIARELHDVVTHNVGVMVIQAGAARKIMDKAPDLSREALLAVEASGRAAMSELRHVMGLLTMDSEGPDAPGSAGLSPQPGLDRLEALVGGVRSAGLPVALTVTGERRPVPPGIELAAYRVVQEALTNTVKHAGGATAEVVVEYAADHLRVEVADTGGRPGASAASGSGRGLVGLRERLAVYGGTVQAGPRLRGGYRVSALIPLESS